SFLFEDAVGQELELHADAPGAEDGSWKRTKMSVAPGDRNVRVALERDLDPPRGTLHARIVDSVTHVRVPVLAAFAVPEPARARDVSPPLPLRMVRNVGELRIRGLADCRWRVWIQSTE